MILIIPPIQHMGKEFLREDILHFLKLIFLSEANMLHLDAQKLGNMIMYIWLGLN